MSLIRFANVTFAYPQQVSLIDQCSLVLEPGWTALVGRNGEGKSTLLNLIDGQLQPNSGQVNSGGLRIRRCRQLLDATAVDEFANAWTPAALKWMSLLGLEPEQYWRWDTLSPGQRRRWQIGAALYDEPGALLLDEPTNHLDSEARDRLHEALGRFKGVGVIVSHDRQFIDRLCDQTARIHRGEVQVYPGGYSKAKTLWEAEAAAALERLEAAQDEVRSLNAAYNQASARHASATNSLSSRSRMTSINDSDARSIARKGRAQRAEASIAGAKSVIASRLDRTTSVLEELERPEGTTSKIFVDPSRCPREFVLRFKAEPLLAGDFEVAERAGLNLRRDERVWLRGPNGCGKTTLLRAALEACDLPTPRVLYIPQQLDADAMRERFAGLRPNERERALHVGAALLLDVRAVLDDAPLSPGETRKLAVALGLVTEPWLLILDEPTNDLDTDSIERLEEAIAEYPGALLLVTHDPYFAERLEAREQWVGGLMG